MNLILSKKDILINPFNNPIIPATKQRIPDKNKPIASVKSVGIIASQINEEYEKKNIYLHNVLKDNLLVLTKASSI